MIVRHVGEDAEFQIHLLHTHTQFHQAKPAKRPDIVKINSIIFCKNVISFFFFFVFTWKSAGGEK